MRILFLAPFAIGGPKGTTRWRVLPLARALAARGHCVQVLIPPYDYPKHSGLTWCDQGVEVVNLVLPSGHDLPKQLVLAQKLAQETVAWRPDVVHCFKPKGPAGLATWLLDRKRGWRIPLVMDADDWETGWNQVAGYPRVWQSFFRWQEHWGLRRADAVTASSRWLFRYASELRAGDSLKADRNHLAVHYLPNGVDPVAVMPAAQTGKKGRIVLLYTRFVEHTPEHVLRVWKHVLAHEPRAQLVVAGVGQRGEVSHLMDAAMVVGISHSILTVGWVPSASRAGLFAATDVAMLPVADAFLNRAKSPMRLLDLMGAGLPVATQVVGEYGLLVQDGVTGLLAIPGDERGLAYSVLRLLLNPELSARLGAAAACEIREAYAWPKLVDIVLNAYRACGC